MTICSKCGKEFKGNPHYPYTKCGSCRTNYIRHCNSRKSFYEQGKPDVLYNTYGIYKANFPEGTTFIKTTASGRKQTYAIKNSKLVYVRKERRGPIDPQRYISFYEALKKADNGWSKADCGRAWYGCNVEGRNISLVLDRLDSMGLLTSEDEKGRIYAYR